MMSCAERSYRNTTTRIGFSMLFFLGLVYLQAQLQVMASILVGFMPPVAADVMYELLGALLYAAVFSLPVFFFRLVSGRATIEPMRMELSVPRETPLYVLFGVSVVRGAAYLNAYMVSFFESSAPAEATVVQSVSYTSNYQLILLFFSLAVVPAFVEEFLFRGLILSNLLPYGRTTAIVGSAVLFGLMHQTAQQLFYTTVAGLVLGWVYVRTRSIWPCVLLHFFNNFRSVFQTPIIERLPAATADVVLFWLEVVILLAGGVSGVFLILRERDPRASLRQSGVFEREPDAIEGYVPHTLSIKSRVKHFFNVPMIIFTAVSLAIVLWTLISLGL